MIFPTASIDAPYPSPASQAEDLVQAAWSTGRPLTARFRLGLIPTIAPFLLPPALPVIRERFPELKLFLREDLTGQLVSALKSGALDAAAPTTRSSPTSSARRSPRAPR